MLNPDGQCLGVALVKTGALLNFQVKESDVAGLSTPSEARRFLQRKARREVMVLLPRGAARLLAKLGASLHRFATVDSKDLQSGDVVLAQRSVCQLYGIPRVEAHWVVLHRALPVWCCEDPLRETIEKTGGEFEKPKPEDVLHMTGVTLVVR